jgi:hypothetical protein
MRMSEKIREWMILRRVVRSKRRMDVNLKNGDV